MRYRSSGAAKPLTALDIEQLAALLVTAGVGDRAQVDEAATLSNGLGRFIRSLIGLERAPWLRRSAPFLADKAATAVQIEFIGMIVNHLTEKGSMDPDCSPKAPSPTLHRRDPTRCSTSPAQNVWCK